MTTDVQDRSNLSPRLTEGNAQDPADGLGRAEHAASHTEAGGAGGRSEMQALFTEDAEEGPAPATNVSKPKPRRYCVYRFFDYDEALLYVGLSCRLGQRLAEHRADKEWWRDVADIKVSHCSSLELARETEARYIRECYPRYNIQGKPDRPEPECLDCGNQDLIGLEWGAMFYELHDVTPEGEIVVDYDARHFRPDDGSKHLWCDNCGDLVPY